MGRISVYKKLSTFFFFHFSVIQDSNVPSTSSHQVVPKIPKMVIRVNSSDTSTATVSEDVNNQNQRKSDELPKDLKFIKVYYWKEKQVLLLLEKYKIHESKFTDVNYSKNKCWKLIHKDLVNELIKQGDDIVPTIQQCESRWKTMTKTFRATVDHNNISGNNKKTCPFFNEMNELYGYRPNVQPVATSNSNGVETKRAAPTSNSSDDKTDEKKKKKYVTAAEASSNTLLAWLKAQDEKREKREEEKLKAVREMHNEKMSIFRDLLSVMRDEKKEE